MEKLFDNATSYVQGASFDISTEDRLYLYSRYKQTVFGNCDVSKPSFFSFEERKKWDAWMKVKDLDKQEAMNQYVTKLTELDPDWESNVFKCKSSWVSVSTLIKPDDERGDIDIFDFVKENKLKQLMQLPKDEFKKVDENLMSPLHWACDRGHVDIVRHLLDQSSIHIDSQDNEGQTPLHYAVSCGHSEVVTLLLSHGANQEIRDNDGVLPIECAADGDIKQLFKKTLI